MEALCAAVFSDSLVVVSYFSICCTSIGSRIRGRTVKHLPDVYLSIIGCIPSWSVYPTDRAHEDLNHGLHLYIRIHDWRIFTLESNQTYSVVFFTLAWLSYFVVNSFWFITTCGPQIALDAHQWILVTNIPGTQLRRIGTNDNIVNGKCWWLLTRHLK